MFFFFYETSYESYPTQGCPNSILHKFVVCSYNMTDMQTCEVNGTLASLILAPWRNHGRQCNVSQGNVFCIMSSNSTVAMQKSYVAFGFNAITNIPVELRTWNLVWQYIIDMCVHCVSDFFCMSAATSMLVMWNSEVMCNKFRIYRINT